MKSLEELRAIKAAAQSRFGIRNDDTATVKVYVGMAADKIAAGSRPVLNALTDAVAKNGLKTVAIILDARVGADSDTPVVKVCADGAECVTYVDVTPEKAARIVDEHIAGGKVVTEYTACAK
jgi:NADP-reducing hydrogenase subunit HndB